MLILIAANLLSLSVVQTFFFNMTITNTSNRENMKSYIFDVVSHIFQTQFCKVFYIHIQHVYIF